MALLKKIPSTWIFPIRMIYTLLFNLYAWYWLVKLIWLQPFEWENLIEWTLACFGMWFFVLDSNDPKFREAMSKTPTYPDLMESK
jgi:hypothetical protein